jgi:methylated-DNA-[protein]-cysteine S-methyltransferase
MQRRSSTQDTHHVRIPTVVGAVVLVWQDATDGPTVLQVFLPRPGSMAEPRRRKAYPESRLSSCAHINRLARRIRRSLEGEAVEFSLGDIALDRCPAFQRSVLRAEARVPRGRVATYAELARGLGRPRAARAVGNALARNPFPIFIPCHRAIRSDGKIGGYQGGPAMKRRLLGYEGIAVSATGRVKGV